MRRLMRTIMAMAALGAAALLLWRRNPRVGTRLMNERIDPFLLRHDVSGGAHSEIGTLEHVGRRSGRRRLTLVHPVATEAGFRLPVPLGSESEWARNVLAAGHCRMYLRGVVYELDEPLLLSPREVPGLSPVRQLAERSLGFSYLQLHRFAERPATLAELEPKPGETELEPAEAGVAVDATPVEAPATIVQANAGQGNGGSAALGGEVGPGEVTETAAVGPGTEARPEESEVGSLS